MIVTNAYRRHEAEDNHEPYSAYLRQAMVFLGGFLMNYTPLFTDIGASQV